MKYYICSFDGIKHIYMAQVVAENEKEAINKFSDYLANNKIFHFRSSIGCYLKSDLIILK